MAAIREDSYDDGYGTGYDTGQTDKALDDARKIMKNLQLTPAEALNALEVPENQQGDYLKKLEDSIGTTIII